MANHAKVLTGKKLNPDEVNEIIQRLNQEKLGGVFTVTFEKNTPNGYGDYQWFVKYKDQDYIAMIFWLSDDIACGYEENDKWIEYDEPKTISEQSCIEFRHGHSFRFMWWVEGVFRENLGKYYNAKMWDDGVGECGPANPERYETFKTYLNHHAEDKKTLRAQKKHHFEPQKYAIPVELIKALDLDFDI